MVRIGIIALQGNFKQHEQVMRRIITQYSLPCEIVYVRTPKDMRRIDALIFPGGESTTIGKLIETQNLTDCLKAHLSCGQPILGTCAGLIILADTIYHAGKKSAQFSLNALHITVERNAYGRQYNSASITLPFSLPSIRRMTQLHVPIPHTISGLSIRSPRIITYPEHSTIIATMDEYPVILQYKHMVLCTFHPEAVMDTTLHTYFLCEIVLPFKAI